MHGGDVRGRGIGPGGGVVIDIKRKAWSEVAVACLAIRGRPWVARPFAVIGSSEKVHVVDALAITGDEGRCSLR